MMWLFEKDEGIGIYFKRIVVEFMFIVVMFFGVIIEIVVVRRERRLEKRLIYLFID